MARDARLALPENLGQFGDGQLAAGAQHEKPQPRRLGRRAQRAEQTRPSRRRRGYSPAIAKHIKISLYRQAPSRETGVGRCNTGRDALRASARFSTALGKHRLP